MGQSIPDLGKCPQPLQGQIQLVGRVLNGKLQVKGGPSYELIPPLPQRRDQYVALLNLWSKVIADLPDATKKPFR